MPACLVLFTSLEASCGGECRCLPVGRMARRRSLEAVVFSSQVLTKSAAHGHFQWIYGSLKLLGRNDVCPKERIGFRFSYDCWAVRRCVNSWIM